MMFPKYHAAISGVAVLLFALWKEVALGTLVLWVAVGAVAGVLIDADHAFLGLIHKNFWKRARWFLHPFRAVFVEPKKFAKDMYYRGFTFYRMISHLIIFSISVYLSGFWLIFEPISIALAAHIAADLYADIRDRQYRNLITGRTNEWED